MTVTKSIMLTVTFAAWGLAAGSSDDKSRNIQFEALAIANKVPRLAHLLQARQASPLATLLTSISSTAVQVPIATACPLNGGSKPFDVFEPVPMPPATLSDVTNSIVSASAIMPDGSTTTFASRARRQDAPVSAQPLPSLTLPGGIMAMPLLDDQSDVGQLVVGLDGCQTLFSPTITAVCSTVVSPAGLPPVTITNCDQYVTFSSETLFTCSQTPLYSPRPYSTTSVNNSTITLGDESFTTRAFPTSGTSTLGEDPVTETTSTSTFAESEQTGLAFLDARDIEEDDGEGDHQRRRQLLKRQFAFLRSKNAPIMTDTGTISPASSAGVEKRQVMFNRNGNQPALTDLETIAPTSSLKLEKRLVLLDHKTNKPAVSDLETVAPVPTARHVRAELMASGYTTGLIANKTNATDGIFVAAGAATRVLSVTPALQAKYYREHVVLQHHHLRRSEPAEESLSEQHEVGSLSESTARSELLVAPLANPTKSKSTMHSAMALNGTKNTITLVNKIALLSPPQPTKYYAALWEDIAKGGVPSHVKGITCYGGLPPSGECTTPDTDGDTEGCECSVQDELWSLTTLSETRVGTTIVSFSGPAVLTYGSITTTTNIEFTSTRTTTRTFASESIVRRTPKPGETVDNGPTITIQQTSIPSATISLVPGDAMNVDTDIKAAMPQDVPAVLTTSTFDTSTDASSTSTPEGASATASGLEISILPYSEPTASEDAYYGATTTIPYENMGLASPGVADTDLEVQSITVDDTGVSTSMMAGDGVDDLATTVFETSIIATETVMVPEMSVTMPIDSEMLQQGRATLVPATRRRRDRWPDDVWLAHLEDAKPVAEPAREGGA